MISKPSLQLERSGLLLSLIYIFEYSNGKAAILVLNLVSVQSTHFCCVRGIVAFEIRGIVAFERTRAIRTALKTCDLVRCSLFL